MKKIRVFVLVAFVLSMGSCKLMNEVTAFAKCKFEFEKLENVKLAAIDIEKTNSITSLGLTDIGKITKAVLNKELMLDMNAVLKITNPNAQNAALNRTDWILMIDDVEITRGTTNQRVEIPAKSSSYMPIHTAFNLMEVFSGKSKEAMFSLARNIAGVGDTPSRVVLKVKPSLDVAGVVVPYPGYIDLERNIGKKN